MINKLISAIRNSGIQFYRPTGQERYERKFVVSLFDAHQLESIIKHHPQSFREIFNKRSVNNIYLDTIDFKTYYDNVYGNTNRIKVRIRWYGDTFGNIDRPVLEMKVKGGLAGSKNSFLLSPFMLDTSFTYATLEQVLHNSDLPVWVREKLTPYRPVILNSYTRKYYATYDKSVRITLDHSMTYYGISSWNNTFIRKNIDRQNLIVEIKYSLDANDIASEVTQHFPMRMTKSSKFVNGVELFYPHLST